MQLSYQAVAGTVFSIIFFGILVGQGVIAADGTAVLLTGVLITNTIGLIFLMFLLGYGLVVFPQTLWAYGNLELRLLRIQQKAALEFKNLGDASFDISICVSNILKTKQEVFLMATHCFVLKFYITDSSNQLPRYADQTLNEAMDIIISECPTDFTSSKIGQVAVEKKSGKVTVSSLAELRRKLYWDRASYAMALVCIILKPFWLCNHSHPGPSRETATSSIPLGRHCCLDEPPRWGATD